MKTLLFAGVTAILVSACSSDDATPPDPYPYAALHAQNVRELSLVTLPPVRTLTPDQYHAETAQNATQESDADIQRTLDSYGRLGFYPPGFDLRGSAVSQSDLFIAYYSSQTKSVTLVGNPAHSTMVHELVHALQDQYFDLSLVEPSDQVSIDASIARSALVEGDAKLAEFRDDVIDEGATGDDIVASLAAYVTPQFAEKLAADTFASTSLPKILASQAAFVYGFGTLYVASNVGVTTSTGYAVAQSNALFAGAAAGSTHSPRTTAEILRAGLGTPPLDLESPGIDELPAFAADYAIDFYDRLGAWLAYVLLLPQGTTLDFYVHWTGDQFMFLRRKDGASSAVMWTTIWDSEDAAQSIAGALMAMPPRDTEHLHVEQRGRQVCLTRNLDESLAAPLVDYVLSTPSQRIVEALHRPATPAFPLRLP